MTLKEDMIEITKIASGSDGNCYRIFNGKDTLMIECGIQFRKIQEAFKFKLSEVAGCLVSHGHSDHSMSIKDFIKKTSVKVFATIGTLDEINIDKAHHLINVIQYCKMFDAGSYRIFPFETQHDCSEPCGFFIASGSDRLLFATDTFYVKPRFSGLTHIMVECNYSINILDKNLKKGGISKNLYDRIIGSHFEIENVVKFLKANDISKVKEIHLMHISKNNGDAELFKRRVQAETGIYVYV